MTERKGRCGCQAHAKRLDTRKRVVLRVGDERLCARLNAYLEQVHASAGCAPTHSEVGRVALEEFLQRREQVQHAPVRVRGVEAFNARVREWMASVVTERWARHGRGATL